MAPSNAKRRKLEHVSSEDDDDDSFAGFSGSEEDSSETAQTSMTAESVGQNLAQGLGLDDGGIDEEPAGKLGSSVHHEQAIFRASREKQAIANEAAMTAQPKQIPVANKISYVRSYESGTSKSGLFKLQVDDMLERVRPRQGKREAAAEAALHRLKQTIEQIAPRPAQSVADAERVLLKEKIVIPYPDPRPSKDVLYKLEYAKPANITVVGSHVLKVASAIDMVVQMPSRLLQSKDYLNYRFFYKRAYYLACVAAALSGAHGEEYSVSYSSMHDDALLPVIQVRPSISPSGVADKPAKANAWQIDIALSTADDVFSAEKLGMSKNCVRNNDEQTKAQDSATPLYNSSLRTCMLMKPYLVLQHKAASSCAAYRDACLMGGLWLDSRRLGSSISRGGFGNFEWGIVVALLLRGGGPNGKALLGPGYSSYQLFKATLQLLALQDLRKKPLVVGEAKLTLESSGSPVIWDAERSHNVLYKMTDWSYQALQSTAKRTLEALGDQRFDAFDSTFTTSVSSRLLDYDCLIELDHATLAKSATANRETSSPLLNDLYAVLRRGLGDRVEEADLHVPPTPDWSIGVARPMQSTGAVTVGLRVNQEHAHRLVDHGPSADNKTEAAAFRAFWGDKAELRRFKDGSILESLVWATEAAGQSVIEQICRHLLQKHFGAKVEGSVRFFDDDCSRLMPKANGNANFQPLMEAYKQLETDIRGLEALPLSIRQIMSADAQLRFSSIEAPSSTHGIKQSIPAAVTLQFEGSSRWPDDLVAVQRTKLAFLLKLSELMNDNVEEVKSRMGLENHGEDVLNQGFLDITYSNGAAFRLRIHHEREQGMLERQMKLKDLDPKTKQISAIALASYKRDFVKGPAHTQAIAQLATRFPVFSGTVRLIKKWFASHLLSNHIPDDIIELFVAQSFIQPYPWSVPSSMQTGFLRTLAWLAKWDWREEPLVVDMSGSGELKDVDYQAIRTRFEAWRKLDPALNRLVLFAASHVDHDGTTWTDGQPSKVVAGRMTALANAAVQAVEAHSIDLNPASLFVSPLEDYDFVLHLSPVAFRSRKKSSKGPVFKNLEVQTQADTSLVGFQPAQDFLAELQNLYGAAIVFFSGVAERKVIAGLWSPLTAPRAWKVNLQYATLPMKTDAEVLAEIDKQSILKEIARLGGNMVESVQINR
ncbi:U3 snoRNP protein [Oleoguttula sp. CCFEE 5521]